MSIGAAILCVLLAFFIGWAHAHNTIAKECERLGRFYVGSKVYHCDRIENKGKP